MNHSPELRDRTIAGRCNSGDGFASAAEGVALREERRELLREAQWSLRQWELHRRELDRGRLLAALEGLARMIRAEAPR
jgi:hypothetical protein